MIDTISKPFDTESGGSIASGDTLLIDNSPSCEPNTVVWQPKNRIPIQPLETFVAQHLLIVIGQEGYESLLKPWPEKKDPFTQADLLDNEEDQTQDLIFRIRTSTSILYREILANRLLTLFNDAKEEDPASFGIAVDSLRNFYNFLHLHTNLKYPSISLTPDDNIYASWRDEQNKVFSVLFLPNGEDARFVIFKPNNRHPKRQIRISGTATTDILIETVEPYKVLDWISE
ncbi:MAG: hypothetical protein GY941_02945 [Planctomycetes bacterium]|nr:hypothetical protein [Planctomycetota bacterium]